MNVTILTAGRITDDPSRHCSPLPASPIISNVDRARTGDAGISRPAILRQVVCGHLAIITLDVEATTRQSVVQTTTGDA